MSRYQTAVALSAGGTGEVFKAYDPVLQRHAALKFLHRDDPLLVERMLREARAQARLEHEGICQVYEIGELDGRPFIAMQFIDGEELGAIASKMTPEQKVEVIWRVALAMHAAHCEGLIHRDLKPANIMVQKNDAGQLRPVVVDFGLVWEQTGDSMTQVGQVLGTPPYLAPEQVEGQREKLDCRTDVYGLGATLYDLLTGRPLFHGAQGVALLMKTVHQDPEPLRKIDSSIPADLETIVLKCVEKEPRRRYESAAALADDLRRFLDGEPIAARPASLSYRLQKTLRRHRPLVVVMAVALVLMLAAVAMAVRARWHAEQRLRYEQRFAQVGKDVDWTMRAVYMSSPHDLGASKGEVRDRIAAIESELEVLGDLGAAPAHYAIGRCYLVLQEDELARAHLQQAWGLGFRSPEVSYALGLALGRQYQHQLRLAHNIASPAVREERLRKIRADIRERAVEHLRAGREAETVAVEYVQALIALYEGSYDDALAKARAAITRLPWLYEARMLEGYILTERGDAERLAGDFVGARRTYGTAEPVFREALSSAGSDPRGYLGLCALTTSRMRLELEEGRRVSRTELESALTTCSQAADIDTELGSPYTLRAKAHLILAEYQTWADQNPTAELDTARALAQRGVELEPGDFDAHTTLGNVDLKLAVYLTTMRRGDPQPACERAAASYRRALKIQPNDPIAANTLGNSYVTCARYQRRNGIDALPSLDRAIEIFEAAIQLTPDSKDLHQNLSDAFRQRGFEELDRGQDFSRSVALQLHHRRRALEIYPESGWAHWGLANAQTDQASLEFLAGNGDPEAAMDQALASIHRAMELSPGNIELLDVLAAYYTQLAYLQVMRDSDPSQTLAEARLAVEQLRELDSDRARYHGRRMMVEATALRWAVKNGGADLDLSSAWDSLDAVAPHSRDIFFFHTATDFLHCLAHWQSVTDQDPNEAIERGLAIAEDALAKDPDWAVLIATRGMLLLLKASSETAPGMRHLLLEQSEQEMVQALSINRWLAIEVEPWLDEARKRLGHSPEIVQEGTFAPPAEVDLGWNAGCSSCGLH